MGLSRRQQRQLIALDGQLRADPRLAGLLGQFSLLNAEDPMPGHEQLPPGRSARTGPLRAAAQAIAWLTRAAHRWPGSYESTLAAAAALAGSVGLAACARAGLACAKTAGRPGSPGRAAGEAATRPGSPREPPM